MPPLHSPNVAAMVPSVSIKAWERKPRGCSFQTFCRVLLMASIKSTIAPWSKRRVKSPLVSDQECVGRPGHPGMLHRYDATRYLPATGHPRAHCRPGSTHDHSHDRVDVV